MFKSGSVSDIIGDMSELMPFDYVFALEFGQIIIKLRKSSSVSGFLTFFFSL